MLKLTKTGIGLLTKQYRSVLRKCLLLNLLFCPLYVDLNAASIDMSCTFGGCGAIDSETGAYIDGFYVYGGLSHYIGYGGTGLELRPTTLGTYMLVGGINENYLNNLKLALSNIFILDQELYQVENQLLNYYYTFRVDERNEVIDSASFFQDDFSTLQKVDLHIKNPTHLGAFIKCDEVCPRPSERFFLSLSQEQMLKNDASVDAGTFSICSLQIENVNEKLSNVFDV